MQLVRSLRIFHMIAFRILKYYINSVSSQAISYHHQNYNAG